MPYGNIIKDPLLVAVLSSLIALFLAHVYGIWKHSRKRASGLSILRHQLENHEKLLRELKTNLEKQHLPTGLDSSPVTNFLDGEIVDLSKDENLISALYIHLGNIRLIDTALESIALRAAGFTSVQNEKQTQLEVNLQKSIDGCIDELQTCLNLV